MRWLLVVVSMLVGGVALGVASPPEEAAACSCAVATVKEYAEWADLVAVGEIVGREVPETATSSGDDAAWTVEIDSLYQGDATNPVHVLTAIEGPSCGWDHVSSGDTIVLFATRDGEAWRSNLCSGTAVLTPELTDELGTALGEPTPVPSPSPTPSESSPPTSVPGQGAGWGVPVIGVALILASAVTLVIGLARTRATRR